MYDEFDNTRYIALHLTNFFENKLSVTSIYVLVDFFFLLKNSFPVDRVSYEHVLVTLLPKRERLAIIFYSDTKCFNTGIL